MDMTVCCDPNPNEPHPQIHQHARLFTAIPHSTWTDKRWEGLRGV